MDWLRAQLNWHLAGDILCVRSNMEQLGMRKPGFGAAELPEDSDDADDYCVPGCRLCNQPC